LSELASLFSSYCVFCAFGFDEAFWDCSSYEEYLLSEFDSDGSDS
jgi:hypothetical protein